MNSEEEEIEWDKKKPDDDVHSGDSLMNIRPAEFDSAHP